MNIDLVGAVVGWLVSTAGDASSRMIRRLTSGSDQERALRRVIDSAVNRSALIVAAGMSTSDSDHLCAVLQEHADFPIEIELDRLPNLSAALQEWVGTIDRYGGYLTAKGVDPQHLTQVLAREISEGIRQDALQGGPLYPIAEILAHDRLIGLAEFQISELTGVRSQISVLVDMLDRQAVRPIVDELSRIERANHEWVISTRSFYIQRLLQAIAEIEYPAGRLEAGRVVNAALEKYRTASSVKSVSLLSVCEDLEAHELFRFNWKLRRMLARVVGDIIGMQLGPSGWRVTGGFCEKHLQSPEGRQLLAEAAVEHGAAAQSIGAPVLYALLSCSEPQVPWQLLRRWPVIAPIVSERVSLATSTNVANLSIRRMLLLAQMLYTRRNSKAMKGLLREAKSNMSMGTTEAEDTYFYQALMGWSSLYTSISVPGSKSAQGALIRIEPLLNAVGSSDRKGSILVESVPGALELDSIERDLRNADGSYLPHPSEGYSEGRYGYTRHFVKMALRVAPSDSVSALIANMLECVDEGIRWGVAADLINWWTLIPEREEAEQIVLRLIKDDHPWVVREVAQRLAMDQYLCQAIGASRLTQLATEQCAKLKADGWDIAELSAAIQRIAALSW